MLSVMAKKITALAIETDQRRLNSLVEAINQEVDCKVVGIGSEIGVIF
jgi:hypothetical protein